MTEPLGRSQVLEYLSDLNIENKIYLFSFERKNDLDNLEEIERLTKNCGIEWKYLIYSNRYGVFSTTNQIIRAIQFSFHWIKKNNITIIHARSMIPATIGLLLKKIYGVKLLFDIRGFAIDEKVDSGRLRKKSVLFNALKRLDNYLYCSSDHIVTLTHTAKNILHKKLTIPLKKITVIPTCANKDVFKVMDKENKNDFKATLGYTISDKIIIHTGTVSGWYDFETEILLVKEMMQQDKNIHFVILNKTEQPFIKETLERNDFPMKKVNITSSTFDKMYQYLGIADLSLFFIKPSYSKQASAPTKFAENVSCHLPSITNSDVGDMSYYLERYHVGHVINLHTLEDNMEIEATNIIKKISSKSFNPSDFNSLFNEHFDKKIAIQKYQQIYEKLG